MWGKVSDAFDRRDREVRGGHLISEILADESVEFLLVVEGVDDAGDAAGAVSEQEGLQSWLARLGEPNERVDVICVFANVLHVEALAIRLAATAQIDGVYSV